MTRAILLGCLLGCALVGGYALATRAKRKPAMDERKRKALLLSVLAGAPCPPDCPVCRANELVVERMRRLEGEGWSW